MNIKMIAFDLDGTVFDNQKRILPKTKAALEKAAADGIEIVPATGRPLCGVSEQIWQLKGVRYILTTNGAGIYEAETGKCIYENSMKLERFLPMMARLEPLEAMGDAFVKGKCFMSRKNLKLLDRLDTTEEMKAYIRSSRTCVDNLTEFLRKNGEDIQKITINFVKQSDGTLCDYDRVQEIIRDFPEFIAVSGGMNNIEVTDKTASKGIGILKLGEILGIKKEEILAFGDSGNDVAMLQMAGFGVAMENAEPEAKAAADFVTRSNTEEGIAYALEKFL
ncbi:MAG: HAD family phosphatase [Lachnospiraceae bacterium]|nr:HAD family phosphatase [Lachnospiraceae bacterium]